jgi:hypothetical protein
MAGPYGQWPELEPERRNEMACKRLDEHEASSVCEQRNAALVRTTLGERGKDCEARGKFWVIAGRNGSGSADASELR